MGDTRSQIAVPGCMLCKTQFAADLHATSVPTVDGVGVEELRCLHRPLDPLGLGGWWKGNDLPSS